MTVDTEHPPLDLGEERLLGALLTQMQASPADVCADASRLRAAPPRRRRTPILAAAGALIVTGGAMGAVLATGDDPPAPVPMEQQTPITASGAPSGLGAGAPATLTTRTRDALARNAADYGLHYGAARSLPAPKPDGSASSEDWIVVPGDAGVCLVFPGAQITCTTTSEFKQGRALMASLPETGSHRSGSASGIVPDGIVRVIAVDARGRALTTATVRDNLYRLTLTDPRTIEDLQLVRRDGLKVPLHIGF